MKYYLTLIGFFVVLVGLDMFFSRLFMRSNVSLVLAFLLTTAFIIPQKTRYIFRTLIPLMLICGLAGDSMSAVSPGIIFITYCLLAIIVLSISKNIPSADSIGYLILVVFSVCLIYRLFFGVVFNGISFEIVSSVLLPSFFSAIYTTVGAVVIAYLFETSFGRGLGKIIFNED
ncbi:MAG: hypothetical protein Q7S57_03080 [bacterium]|nr:hypothetical protein [bacterium]